MTTETQLQRNAIGLREVVFQSICSMAPGAAIAASIPFGAPLAGGALPLAVIFAFVGIFFTASSIGQLAKHIPSSGSVATYSAIGLRPWVGFLVGWGYAAVEVLIVPLVMLQLGYTVAGEWNSKVHSFPLGSWWVFTALGTILVCYTVWLGIRTSAKTATILGFVEIAVFALLSIVLIVKAGGHNTLAVFTPKYATAAGFHGWSGVIAGSVFTLLAFSGFEAAAPMAEETENPRRNVPRAIMIATVCIGVLYAFSTYAADVAYGPSRFTGFAASANGVPWDGLANSVSIVFWALVLFAIINSTLANAIAGTNVFTRTAFAFGRAGAFPKSLAKLNEKHRSPQNALIIQLILGLVIALALGAKYGPTTAFGIVATGLVVVVVVVYAITNLACIGYFAKHRREERHAGLHIVVPILGFIFLVPGFMNAAGITGVPGLKFVSALPAPLSYGAWAMGAWAIVGLVSLLVLRSKSPDSVDAVAFVHE
ncbi:MAG TPA: APC family permease [Acidimicrobiales bacterium]|nr:APC family permease [Acidimicrobiales bacterium]